MDIDVLKENRKLFLDNIYLDKKLGPILQNNAQGFLYCINKNDIIKNNIYKLTPYLITMQLGERLYHILNNLYDFSTVSCECGKRTRFNTFLKGYNPHCSIQCVNNSQDVLKKREDTNLKNHGSTCYLNSIEGRKNIQDILLDKYGVDNPLKDPTIQNKTRDSFKKQFYDRLLNSERLQDKYIPLFTIDEYQGVKDGSAGNFYKWQCLTCSNIFVDDISDGHMPRCKTCFPVNTTSRHELNLISFIQSLNITTISSSDTTTIKPYELDIFLSEFNTAIEVNGLYWHSELKIGNKLGKSKKYHQDKLIKCNNQNIKLLQFFDDEIIEKEDIIKNIISSNLYKTEYKLNARQCIFKKASNQESQEFLKKFHLQGEINGEHYGLYYNNYLVSVLTIGSPRFSKSHDLEILRFCCYFNTTIRGGLSKFIKNIARLYPNKKIVTYADARYGTGKSYIKSGFRYMGLTSPGYFYTKNYAQRLNRMNFQKHKLKDILNIFDPNLTEWENMHLNGYDRIWDAGNYVYEMIL